MVAFGAPLTLYLVYYQGIGGSDVLAEISNDSMIVYLFLMANRTTFILSQFQFLFNTSPHPILLYNS